LNPITDENPAGSVVVYIDTDDITATLDSVEESGGKSLVPKMPIPGMGWFGIFMDPTGNRIGLYTADPQAP
jgi:predicted enzyme related to lactoylglutathione lyase